MPGRCSTGCSLPCGPPAASHTEEDFTEQRHEPVAPLASGYRGRTVLEIPPNGGGITAQIMLNILEGFELSGLDPVGTERLHLEMEAQRLAYAQRDAHVADMRHSDVPVVRLLSDDFAARTAQPYPARPGDGRAAAGRQAGPQGHGFT